MCLEKASWRNLPVWICYGGECALELPSCQVCAGRKEHFRLWGSCFVATSVHSVGESLCYLPSCQNFKRWFSWGGRQAVSLLLGLRLTFSSPRKRQLVSGMACDLNSRFRHPSGTRWSELSSTTSWKVAAWGLRESGEGSVVLQLGFLLCLLPVAFLESLLPALPATCLLTAW